MSSRQAEPYEVADKKTSAKNKLVFAVVALLVAFLAGYLPGYFKARQYEEQLRVAGQENSRIQLRDLAGLAWLQATQKDYGLAAATSTRLFDRTRQVADQSSSADDRKALESLLSLRDQTSAKLAGADSGAASDLQALFIRTRQVTAVPSDSQQ